MVFGEVAGGDHKAAVTRGQKAVGYPAAASSVDLIALVNDPNENNTMKQDGPAS